MSAEPIHLFDIGPRGVVQRVIPFISSGLGPIETVGTRQIPKLISDPRDCGSRQSNKPLLLCRDLLAHMFNGLTVNHVCVVDGLVVSGLCRSMNLLESLHDPLA